MIHSVSVKYFVAGAPKLSCEPRLGCRPPALAAADHHEGPGRKHPHQSFNPIAAQVQQYFGVYRALTRDYVKAALVPIQQYWRARQRKWIWNHLRHE